MRTPPELSSFGESENPIRTLLLFSVSLPRDSSSKKQKACSLSLSNLAHWGKDTEDYRSLHRRTVIYCVQVPDGRRRQRSGNRH
ncbi:hypothetical protein MRB53_011108 [Persea americana]|uniref:Uncharacterized protein n=1 Tax=Persea americana TaxID=3435 RepID=A0ACC2LTY7_PERAE|nr:hypothetical protein MRB53_011108 [Persea americana]